MAGFNFITDGTSDDGAGPLDGQDKQSLWGSLSDSQKSQIGASGISAGGQFLAQYMAQRAQEAQNKRDALVKIAQAKGQMDSSALNSILGAYAGVLRK